MQPDVFVAPLELKLTADAVDGTFGGYGAKRQGGRLDPDEQDRITATCLRETVLLDWRGLEGEDGAPMPYSKDLAGDLLSKPEFRRFREGVIWAAAQVGEARRRGRGRCGKLAGCLKWSLRWSDHIAWAEFEMEVDPGFHPTFMLERPDLWPHLALYSEAFAQLTTDRPLGALGGVGSIPWTALDRYAARLGLDDPDEFERFQKLIRAQDRAYLEHAAEAAKAKGGK